MLGVDQDVSPQLAVGQDGSAIAAWSQGPPPYITSANGLAVPKSWPGYRVEVAFGHVNGTFRAPLTLTSHGSGELYLARSGLGRTVVAWSGAHAAYPPWSLASSTGHAFSAPQALPDSQILGVISGRDGPVGVVWQHDGQNATLTYSLVDRAGRLPAAAAIAQLGRDDSAPVFAINDRGQLAAAWVRTAPTGLPETTQLAVCAAPGRCHTQTLTMFGRGAVVVCSPRGRCARPSPAPSVTPSSVKLAVTISDNGTVAVLADGEDSTNSSSEGLRGLWARSGRRDGPLDRPTFSRPQLIAQLGTSPVAATTGRDGTIAVFNVGYPTSRLAWTTRDPGSTTFTRPTPIADTATLYTAGIATTGDRLLLMWWHSPRNGPNRDSLMVATGTLNHLGPPQTVAPYDRNLNATSMSWPLGIDANGNALLIANAWTGLFTIAARGGA